MRKICFIIIILLYCSGCSSKKTPAGNTPIQTQEVEGISENEMQEENDFEVKEEQLEQNGYRFTTEYKVEDYFHGCVIVSKLDGRLKGVLDLEGKEIIPVKYDDIDFLNKEELEEDVDDEIYLSAKYEGKETLYNGKGDIILENLSEISRISFVSGVYKDIEKCFVEKDMKNIEENYYDKNGKLVDKVSCDSGDELSITWISPEYYLKSVVSIKQEGNIVRCIDDVSIFTQKHVMVKEWKNVGRKAVNMVENNHYLTLLGTNKGETIGILLNLKNGEVKEQNFGELSYAEVIDEIGYARYILDKTDNQEWSDKKISLGKGKNITLYYSNDSWKLEDEQGNSLYDERYYECYEYDGCYFLLNENNELCMIDRNGKILIDYGIISYQNEKRYYDGMELNPGNCLVGDDGVCIVQESEGNNNVYCLYNGVKTLAF